MTARRISGEIAASAAGASDIVNVTASEVSPNFAARLANAYAQQFALHRQGADRAQVTQAARQLQIQISPPGTVSCGFMCALRASLIGRAGASRRLALG